MTTIEDILNDERYRKLLENLDNETLRLVIEDQIKTMEYAHQNIKRLEPEKAHDLEYLQSMADGMQKLAKILLKEKSEENKNR